MIFKIKIFTQRQVTKNECLNKLFLPLNAMVMLFTVGNIGSILWC